ncbi:MAG TPA: EamA family transporter [Candidatus Paceibacterota bacterium]
MNRLKNHIFWIQGPALIVIAAILWGMDGLLRRSLYSLPAVTIVFYEHLIGTIIILPFFLRIVKKETLNKKEWGAIVLVSFLSGVLGTLFFTLALKQINFISFSVVFLLQKLQPVFAITAGVLLLREKINKKFLLWAVLALAAAYFVTFPGGQINLQTGAGTITAALLALGAALAWGSSTAFSRSALLRHSNTLITGWRFILTTGLALIFVLGLRQSASLATIDAKQLGILTLIAISTGMVALWLYYRGLKFTQTKVATILELAFPLTGILIDLIVYKNTLLPSQYLAGAALIFIMQRISKLNREVDGRRYSAMVVAGYGRGKQIGSPTLNLAIPENFPHHHGIYAGRVSWKSNSHPAAIHYGPVPTFNNNQPTLEAFVLDQNITDPPQELELELLNFLRPIQKYENTAELREQISKDVREAKKILAER